MLFEPGRIGPITVKSRFVRAARAARRRLKRVPLILVGGIRTTDTMGRILAEGAADYISMARPFIREPDLPNRIVAGKRGLVDCVSCNVCMEHEGHDPLQCWRIDKRMLLRHLLFRLRGGGHRAAVRRVPALLRNRQQANPE